ncbi:hypothetical protein [Paenibacillus piri]|uniref:Uncharacterized protein n=1 Tax=Paenibacillus piri TaxID=2547395 RepID=A0A4R5KU26_9BACL|nr:hypothetical protein [Paenibacillus piri]TDF99413.1 hypothetical protein E1757_06050 [Paenibacillus piri]
MWETILKNEQWELQADTDRKSILFNVFSSDNSGNSVSLELTQSGLFELIHAFLSINRALNNETMYYDDLDLNHPD